MTTKKHHNKPKKHHNPPEGRELEHSLSKNMDSNTYPVPSRREGWGLRFVGGLGLLSGSLFKPQLRLQHAQTRHIKSNTPPILERTPSSSKILLKKNGLTLFASCHGMKDAACLVNHVQAQLLLSGRNDRESGFRTAEHRAFRGLHLAAQRG